MKATRAFFFALLLVASSFFPPAAFAVDGPLVRARLNLAWDSLDQKKYEEALSYLPDGSSASESAEEIIAIRYECFSALKRYQDFLSLLRKAPFLAEETRYRYGAELAGRWVREAMAKGDYGEAKKALREMTGFLGQDEWFMVFAEEVSFREKIHSFLETGEKEGALPHGCRVRLFSKGEVPEEGWLRMFPGDPGFSPLVRSTPEEWLPGLQEKIVKRGLELGIRCDKAVLAAKFTEAARKKGLAYDSKKDEFVFGGGRGKREERVQAGLDLWRVRSALEGVGPLGAAIEAVDEAFSLFGEREKIDEWIAAHKGVVSLERTGDDIEAVNTATGRRMTLKVSVFGDLTAGDSQEWMSTWRELREELGRPQRPLKCFCGRDVTLRETLSREGSKDALTKDAPEGYFLTLTASCLKHDFPVTSRVAGDWKLQGEDLFARAKSFAGDTPQDIYFERAGDGESERFLFVGEGAGTLPTFPERLLALMEAVDGSGFRNREVAVYAPTRSALLVSRGPGRKDFDSSDVFRAAGYSRKIGAAGEPLGYSSTVRLPARGQGRFSLRKME
jgi:tetratricopeptide (TPR) repeat protein